MGALGFLKATIPSADGGAGLSEVAFAILIEELAAECATTAIIASSHHSLCVRAIYDRGTPEHRLTYLEKVMSGKILGCFALSEPGVGSDASALQCRAIWNDDNSSCIVTGQKAWITNGPEASVVLLFLTEEPSKQHQGIFALLHPLPYPGVIVGKREDKLGIRGSATASITYDGAKFSAKDVIGMRGEGFKIAMETLNGGRIGVAAQALGIARASLRDALTYAQERKTFSRPIANHQTIQNYLADMIVQVDSARYLTYAAARLKEHGRPFVRAASMAKLAASKAAVSCADKCVQIHGGYGYVTDYPAERHYRDAKITEIYEGTTEIQRMIIARNLLDEAGNKDRR
jgi:butyryl-CoA dehydrogenase